MLSREVTWWNTPTERLLLQYCVDVGDLGGVGRAAEGKGVVYWSWIFMGSLTSNIFR